MKYLAFFGFALAGVPAMASAAMSSTQLRGWLVTLLFFSPVIGDASNINFLSMESYRGPDRGFEVNLTDLVALSLGIALLARRSSKVQWLPYNSLLMFAWFGVALVSSAQAPVKVLSAFTLFKLVKLYGIYWVTANTVRLDEDLRPLWRGLLLSGLFLSVIAVKQKYLQGIYRIPGPFDHSNTIPLFVNQFLPVLLLFGLVDRRLSRPEAGLSILASLGSVFAVVATFSRAGMALSGACLFGALGLARWRSPSRRVNVTAMVVLAAVMVGGAMAADSIIDRIQNAPEASEKARDEFNIAAEMMAEDHAFGVGLNNFSHVLTYEARYHGHIEVMKDEEQSGVAHHIYKLTAAEMGYPGLVLFLLILGRFTFLCFWKGLRNRTLEGTLLVGFGIGSIALHASGFLEWAFRISPVFYSYTLYCGAEAGVAERLR